ncbi:uncharacterized protein PHALS_13060 [Plasmopara halstedii]|uniref:RxLR-like protein n=1 Tax=Plasmopara halstedii TaxID=4781 RepID=A0A0P1ANJ4_PLAHL|nr:uncharacterized protein PHALS_13060 [Plasmopara halstedii]CEG42816.1 hypothetical protein PHALS_13060 [Plasmopara halstedii]|eukprot:XP_024579185.1 hypothetical protein PHALS_13060 [Plasmopara halstedii]
MQVHRRWLTLVLVMTLRSLFVDAQVFTMQSLDGEPASLPNLNAESNGENSSTTPGRTWIPITVAPTEAPTVPGTPEPPPVNPEPVNNQNHRLKMWSIRPPNPVEDSAQDPPIDEEEPNDVAPSRKKKKEFVFTKSPFLEQTTPVPNGIRTATEDVDLDESASRDTNNDLLVEKPPPQPKRKQSNVQTKNDFANLATVSNAGSSASSRDFESNNEDLDPTEQVIKKNVEDSTSDIPTTDDSTQTSELPASSTSSSLAESSMESGSAASVLTDTGAANQSVMSNTLLLGLMLGGAVALILIVAVFVYMKTSSATEEEDDMARVLRTGHTDENRVAAQSSTIAANYHKNHVMSPTTHSEDDYHSNQDGQYDQEPYGHPGQLSIGRLTYNDPNLDMLTPRSQIALAHSQMSLPPMAQSGYSHGSSQYSDYSAQSSIYDHSGYSAASKGSSAYSGIHHGKEESDVPSSSEDESDFEGDSIQDMSNVWKSAGRNKDSMLDDSQFNPADSRSTSASDYASKKRFQESEYTEYRMSNGYEDSFAATNSDYYNSGYDKSGFDKSDYDKSGYDDSFVSGKSFQSSGFSEYDQSVARSQRKNSDSSSFYRGNESRFTDKSFY